MLEFATAELHMQHHFACAWKSACMQTRMPQSKAHKLAFSPFDERQDDAQNATEPDVKGCDHQDAILQIACKPACHAAN